MSWRELLGIGTPTQFTRRALLLGAVQAGGLGLLGARLYQIQVLERQRYAPLADDNRIEVELLAPQRGRLMERSGVLLAANDETFHVAIRHSEGRNLKESLELLSHIVPMSPEERALIADKARKLRVGTPLTIARDLTFDQVAAINLLAPQLPGIETGTTRKRRYYHGVPMGHITGYIGKVEKLAIDDDPVLRLDTMKVGKTGAERGFETALRGHGGQRKFEVDARGRIIRILEETEPTPGRDIVLSIDLKLQEKVVQRLQQEGRAALVVLDVASGEILSLASVPTYDPALLTEKTSGEAWKAIANADDGTLLNRAIGGLYPPGSTFKMVTALAALRAGVITLEEKIDCDGSFQLADQSFRCWKHQGHGRCDLHRALRESCDVFFYEAANRVGINAIAAMGRELGLGQTYSCGLPSQKKGVVPDADWKKAALRKAWLGGETVLAGIGQGYVQTTPLQLAVMTARIATGQAVRPMAERAGTGEARVAPVLPLDIEPRWLDAVRKGMTAVVNEDGGTGSNAYIPGGPVVAGKTGTSQVIGNSSRREDVKEAVEGPRDHALFVSYFPANAPRYAIAAVVENGGGGGATAAPLVREVIEAIISDDPAARPLPDARAPQPKAEGNDGTGSK